MNISHLVNTELSFSGDYLICEKKKIDHSDLEETSKLIEKLRLPSVYHILLTKLIKDAELMTDENKLELMNQMIEMNNDASKYLPWLQK